MPTQGRTEWTDQRVEETMGRLLQAGVLLSAAVVLLGGILYLVHHGPVPSHYSVFVGESADRRSVFRILQTTLRGESRGLIMLGLLLLIATPIARVGFSAFAFWRERDHTYVVLTLIVLAILLFSLLWH